MVYMSAPKSKLLSERYEWKTGSRKDVWNILQIPVPIQLRPFLSSNTLFQFLRFYKRTMTIFTLFSSFLRWSLQRHVLASLRQGWQYLHHRPQHHIQKDRHLWLGKCNGTGAKQRGREPVNNIFRSKYMQKLFLIMWPSLSFLPVVMGRPAGQTHPALQPRAQSTSAKHKGISSALQSQLQVVL